MLRLASLLTALMVAAAVASPTSQVSTLPVGVIDGYFDTQCTIFDAEIRPVVNIACAALPDNSIAVTDQACGHGEQHFSWNVFPYPPRGFPLPYRCLSPPPPISSLLCLPLEEIGLLLELTCLVGCSVEIYTDGACKSNRLRVELNACTDTSAYNSVKVVCP